MRIVHVADLHLGRKSIDDPLGAVRLQALRKVLTAATDRVAEAILVAGDVFESPHVDSSVVRMAARAFDAARDGQDQRMPVVIIPGNHDPSDADGLWNEFVNSLDAETAVQVALAPTHLELSNGRIQIEAYPCQSRYSPEAPWAERVSVPESAPNCVRIVLAHGTLLGGPVPDGESDAYPFTREHADSLGVDYIALGHFHGVYPAWDGSEEVSRGLCYAGTHEPDQFGSDAGWILAVDLLPKQAPIIRRVPVGISRWKTLAIEQPIDLDKLQTLTEEIESDSDPKRYRVRIRLPGATMLSEKNAKRLDDLEAGLRALGVSVEQQGELQTYLDVENLDISCLPSGAIREALISLRSDMNAAEDPEEYERLRSAVQLGWKHFQIDS